MFGSGKSSLETCFIEISKIDAYASTSIPLEHGDDVRNPIRIIYCLNEISIRVRRQLKRGVGKNQPLPGEVLMYRRIRKAASK